MGLLGTSAQAFTDNFLKTYMAIGEDRRAEASLKLAKQMAKAHIKEMQEQALFRQAQMRDINAQADQREYALQQDASLKSDMINLPVTINQRGLMQSGIIDPTTQSSDPVALKQVVMGQRPQGLLGGELAQPTMGDVGNVVTKYNPLEGYKIRADYEAALEATRQRSQDKQTEMANRAEQARQHDATLRAIAAMRENNRGGLKATTLKFQTDYNKASSKRDELKNQLDDIDTHADRLLTSALDRITGVIGVVPNMPGSKASDAQASLNSFKSKLGLSTLANLKSGTGAGLGQVTEAEHKLLQNYLSELENAQSEQSLRASIQRIKKWSQDAKGRIDAGYNRSIYGQYDREQNGETQPPSGGLNLDSNSIDAEIARRKALKRK